MANVGASLDPIHLQPKQQFGTKKNAEKADNIVPYVAAMAVMLVAAVAVAVVPMLQYKGKQDDKADLERKIENLSGVEMVYNDYYSALDKLTDMEAFYLTTCDSTEWAVEFIEFLEKEMPASMRFESLSINAGVVSISGITISEYELSGFLDSLENENHISNIVASGYTKNYETNTVTFGLTFNISSEALLTVEEEETQTGEETQAGEEAN